MPSVRQIAILSSAPSDLPGGTPVYTVRLQTGARIEDVSIEERVDIGIDANEEALAFLVSRTPGLESALRGNASANPRVPPADHVRYDGNVYAIRRTIRILPNSVRILVGRVT